MSNIVVNHYEFNSPSLICCLEIKEENNIVCNVTKYWVEKGKGKIDILINNHCDFRTIIQLDVKNLLCDVIDSIIDINMVLTASIYSQHRIRHDIGQSVFEEPWHLCHQGLAIDNQVYDISDFKLTMTFIEDE